MLFLWSGSGEPQVHLNDTDCINYLSEEIAFGKVLRVFHFLLDKIAEDPERYKEWMNEPRYNSGKEIDQLKSLAEVLKDGKDM